MRNRTVKGEMFNMSKAISWFAGYTLAVDFKALKPPENDAAIKRGRIIYGEVCAVCHGIKGDGRGERAGELEVKPRDFTYGIYKFRSTPGGFPPTDEDIFKTVSRGLHGTSMLPMLGLTDTEKWQAVYFIKTLSDVFEEKELDVIRVPRPTKSEHEYVMEGEALYKRAKCYDCHGDDGYGDGEKADKLKDDWFQPVRPRNFQKDILKRGLEVEDIYLTIATGLYGTPMESYYDKLKEDEILAISHYIRRLARKPSMKGMTTMEMQRKMTHDERIGMSILFHDLWGHSR